MIANSSSYETKISVEVSIVLVIFTSLQIIVGTVANGVVIITILSARELRRRSEDHLILNLTIADVLGLGAFLTWHTHVLVQGSIPEELYRFYEPLHTAVFNYEGNAILAIAVDRFIAVVFPLKHRNIMTRRTTLFIAVISCGIAVFFAVIEFLQLSSMVDYKTFKDTILSYKLLLLITTPILYVIIFCCIVKKKRAISNQRRSVGADMTTSLSLLKTTVTTLGLAALFHATYLPTIIYLCCISMRKFSTVPIEIQMRTCSWIYSFLFLNSCVNPIVYALRTNRFKASFYRKILAKIFHQMGAIHRRSVRFSVPSIRH